MGVNWLSPDPIYIYNGSFQALYVTIKQQLWIQKHNDIMDNRRLYLTINIPDVHTSYFESTYL